MMDCVRIRIGSTQLGVVLGQGADVGAGGLLIKEHQGGVGGGYDRPGGGGEAVTIMHCCCSALCNTGHYY